MTLRRRLPLRPFELVTFAMAAAVVLFLRARSLRLDWNSVDYMAAAMLHRFPGVLALGVGLHLAAHLVTWRSPAGWLRDVLRPRQLLLLARVWLAAMVMTYAYSWLKVCVPLLRSDLYDATLWRLDRWLHLGVSPSLLAGELFGKGALAPWIDAWYALWLTTVLAAQSVLFLSRSPERRRNFALACVLLWLAGAWIYFALPATGPAFFTPDAFAEVLPRLPHAAALEGKLWGNYVAMIAAREHGALFQFKPFLAVAAMPSLHVGAHWMFALWARRHARRWFPPLAVATALTFVGSLLTGLHYAVDGYAGMLLAWGAVALADRWEPVSPPPPVAEAGAPAAAAPALPGDS